MAAFLSDTFTEASNTALTSHTPETGGTWTNRADWSGTLSIVASGDYVTGSSAVTHGAYYNNATPPSADYYVEGVIQVTSVTDSANRPGVCARMSSSAWTLYYLYYFGNASAGSRHWTLNRAVGGVHSEIGLYTESISINTDHTIRLECVGTVIKAFINGVERIAVDDGGSAITATGFAGVMSRSSGKITSVTADVVAGGGSTETLTSSLDAALLKQGVTVMAGLDAALKKAALTRQASLDAALMKAGIAITAGVDAYLLGGFTPLGVEFDGTNDYLTRGAGLTGAADGPDFLCSMWLAPDAVNLKSFIRTPTPGPVWFQGAISGSKIRCQLRSAGGSLFEFDTGALKLSQWNSVLIRANTNATAGNKVAQVYVNDVAAVTVNSDAAAAFNIDWTTTDFAIGADVSGGTLMDGCEAEIWIDDASGFDLSIEANRRKFLNADGTPADLGSDGSTPTGTVPLVYLSYRDGDSVTDFATNRGTGGNFSITGELAACATPPALVTTVTKTASLDAALMKLGITVAASLDAALKRAGVTLTASVDAVVFRRQALTAALDAALMKNVALTAGLDAVVTSDGGVAIQAAVDAALMRMGVPVTASVDAAVAKRYTLTAGLDAALLGLGMVTAGLDAAIVSPGRVSAVVDAVIARVGNVLQANVDAFLVTPVGDRDAAALRHGSRGYKVDQPGRSFATSGRRRGTITVH